MKTLLYTGHDNAYSKLAAITVPRMAEYAECHGMDFTCHTEPLINVPNGIYWTGVCGALKAFEEGYERAIYLDVDQFVTNMEFKIQDWQFGFHASKDWGEDAIDPWHFSMCGFVVYSGADGILRMVLDKEPEYRDKPFPEQLPMQDVVKMVTDGQPRYHRIDGDNALIQIHPRKVFNCVPDQVCPGKVPEPWAKGDWCAHLTMLPLDGRVSLARQILNEIE
jgi:hypothetical protein